MGTSSESGQDTNADRPQLSLFDELKRRKVFRVVAAYAVAAWLLLQVVDVLAGAFPVPDWSVAAASIVLLAGFPVAAALSWAFQITPQGIVLDVNKATKKNRSQFIHFLDVTIICVLLVVVAFLTLGEKFMRPDISEIRVAVLSFENLSDDESVSYLSEGIADDIRSRLYEVPQLLIAARSSSRALSGKEFDIKSIGERLTVEHVLEGTIRRVDDRIRVTAQLVDVATGFNRWSKTYNTRFHDVLEMQNNISLVVASELELLLTKDLRRSLAKNPTDDPIAYDYYMRARDYLYRPRSAETLDHAATLYRQAIGKDANFALGYAGLCQTDIARYMHTGNTEFVATANGNCERALALDESLSDVHVALGELQLSIGNLEAAEESFRTATDIDPRAIDAWSGMGDVFAKQGRLVEAEARYNAAIEILPANWNGYNQLAYFMLNQGRYDEAAGNYRRVVELSPDNANGFNNLGAANYMLGDFEEAAANFRSSLQLAPGRAAYSNTGTMSYFAGQYQDAADMFEKAVEIADHDYRLWGNLADASRFIDGAEAGASYERAIELALAQIEVSGDNAFVLANLAWYHANTDRMEAAESYLMQAETTGGGDGEYYYVAGLCYTLLGHANAAEQAILKATELGFPEVVMDATPELSSST